MERRRVFRVAASSVLVSGLLAWSGFVTVVAAQDAPRTPVQGIGSPRDGSQRRPAFAKVKDPVERRSLFEAWSAKHAASRRGSVGTESLAASGPGAMLRASLVINASNTVLYTKQFLGTSCEPDKGTTNEWQKNFSYTAFTMVRPITGGGGLFFFATNSGTSGSTEPAWPTTHGSTVVDGGVTWKGVVKHWAPDLSFDVGMVVQPNVFFSGAGFNFQATTAGATAGTEPKWPTTVGSVVGDGGVFWRAIAWYPGSFVGCDPMQLILRSSGGSETVVATEGDPVDDSNGEQLSGWADFYAMNDSEQVALRSAVLGRLTEEDESGSGIFTGGPPLSPGSLNPIAESGNTIGGRFACGFSAMVGINGSGQVVYDIYGLGKNVATWTATTFFASGARVRPTTPTSFVFTSSGGTSGASEPAWPTTLGSTVADGTITWTLGIERCDENNHGLTRWTSGTGNELLVEQGSSVGGSTVIGFGSDDNSGASCSGSCEYEDIEGFINSSGHVAVVLNLADGTQGVFNFSGPGTSTQVTRTGGALTAIGPRVSINNSDQVVYRATSGGVDHLFLFTPPSTTTTIVSVGDTINGNIISGIGAFTDINSSGNVVFEADTLPDGSSPQGFYFFDGSVHEIFVDQNGGLASEMVTLNDSNVVAYVTGSQQANETDGGGEGHEGGGAFFWTKAGGSVDAISPPDVITGNAVTAVYAQHTSFARRQLNSNGCLATAYFVANDDAEFDCQEGDNSSGCYTKGGLLFVSCASVCPTITLSPGSLPGGVINVPYSHTITASGGTGPYTFAVTSGSVPSGLTLDPSGLLSGTPDTVGTSNFTVTATDSNGCTGKRNYRIVIASSTQPPPKCNPLGAPQGLVITPSTAPAGSPFTLTWQPVPGADHYEILVSTDGGATFSFLAVVFSTTYQGTVTGSPGTTLTFGVQSVAPCGSGSALTLATLTVGTPTCDPPGPVTNIQIQAFGVTPARAPSPTDYILVTWMPPATGTTPTRYGVRINGDPEVPVFGTSVVLPPRGTLDPITAFVTAYACAPLISAELYDPVGGTWGVTGNLNLPRQTHTATLLGDGRVLVAGGATNLFTTPSPTAELYDPTSGMWTTTGALLTPRDQHAGTLLTGSQSGTQALMAPLASSQVLVEGGFGTAPLASSELYDPVAGSWSSTGALATARDLQTATLLTNGKVLVVGGLGSGPLVSAELYDPTGKTWTSTGSLGTARYRHTATLLRDGRVLVAGGLGASGALSSAEIYDPTSGSWTSTGALAAAREAHTAVLLSSGRVLVAGGDDGSAPLSSAEIYDPIAGTWTATGNLITARRSHTSTLLASGQVLVAGGFGTALDKSLKSAELYDSETGVFTTTGSLNGSHGVATATLLSSGKVLDAGAADILGTEKAGPTTSSATVALFLTPPVASFTISANPRVGEPVLFTDTSSPQATSWLWIFDDGTTDTHQSPTHTFTVAGTHQVSLIASNGAGSSTATQSFVVASETASMVPVVILSSIPIDSQDPGRRRAQAEIAGTGRVMLRIRATGSKETIVFLRFLNAAGGLMSERRLSIQAGSEGVYDLGAYGLRGGFVLELVSDQNYESALTVVGRPGVREIKR